MSVLLIVLVSVLAVADLFVRIYATKQFIADRKGIHPLFLIIGILIPEPFVIIGLILEAVKRRKAV